MKRIFLLFSAAFFFGASIPTAGADSLPDSVLNDIAQLRQMMEGLSSTVKDLKETVREQSEVIQNQTLRLQVLEGGAASAGAVSAATARAPVSAGKSQGFNPEIGVVGTVQASQTRSDEDGEGNDTIALKELELNFSSYVDPYSRLDAIIAFNDNLEEQNVDIEEAYYSHWGLPFGFRGQIGKFRSRIGKQNLQHLHALETVDYAWVIRDFFGEEGLASSGVRLAHDVPNPWDIPVSVTGEVLRGNNGTSFSGVSRRPIFNVHGNAFFEPFDNASLELGWTTLFGDENPPQFSGFDENGDPVTTAVSDGRNKYGVRVYGADTTVTWLLSENRTLKFQNELYFQRRGNLSHVNEDPWGFYSLLDFRFSRQFSTGIRFDYLEPLDVTGEHHASTAVSPYLTFWQSEFASFQVQYTHSDPASADGFSDDAVYLRANFMIGAHKHPVQS